MASNNQTNFEIRFAKSEDKDQIKEVFKYFERDEPLQKYVRDNNIQNAIPTRDEIKEEEKDYAEPSLVAVKDGKIIGACLNNIMEREKHYEKLEQQPTRRSKIGTFLRHTVKEADVFKHFPECTRAMDAMAISVHGDYRKMGIAKKFIERTREVAKEKGCGFIVVDCTSHFSASAVESLGFKKIYSLKYEDYKIDGKVVFKPDPPHVAVNVYVQKID